MAVAFDAASSASETATDISIDVTHTFGNVDNLSLVVGVTYRRAVGSPTVATVEVDPDGTPTSLTLLGEELTDANALLEQWGLSNATAFKDTSQTIRVTFDDANVLNKVVGAVSFSGANNGFGTFASNSGACDTPENPNLSVTSATDEIVIDTVTGIRIDAAPADANQTERWHLAPNDVNGAGSTEAGAASVSMDWECAGGGNPQWGIAGVSVKAAAADELIFAFSVY